MPEEQGPLCALGLSSFQNQTLDPRSQVCPYMNFMYIVEQSSSWDVRPRPNLHTPFTHPAGYRPSLGAQAPSRLPVPSSTSTTIKESTVGRLAEAACTLQTAPPSGKRPTPS
eukprot:29184-Chlamydomonas_euryale.AAC.1